MNPSKDSSNNIYTPKGAIPLNKEDYNFQLRIGIQGEPKSGKSYAALTFPNPIVISYDRGLISHIGRSDVLEIPFYSDSFVDSIVKRTALNYVDTNSGQQKVMPANRKDALIRWLATEGMSLTDKQTLILDASTGIEAAYHIQYWTSPKITQNGQVDAYGEWRWKIDYFTELAMLLKAVKCNVIYICHESPDRDKSGELNGKVRPLLTGQFVDQLASHFNNWFRAVTVGKPTTKEKAEELKTKLGVDSATLTEWINSTPPSCGTIYLWQTQSDNLAKCGTSLIGAPKFILANAESFNKYKKKV